METATDYSMWGLFLHATLVVKIIMIMLVAASVWCWAIIIDKAIQYRRARKEAAVFDAAFWSGEPLDALFEQIGPNPKGQSSRIFAAGMIEWRRSHRQDGA
jgi:biopolymer transport protein TolQ